jgi:hypothetical protein
MRLLICIIVLGVATLMGCVYNYRIETATLTVPLTRSQLEPFWIKNGFVLDTGNLCDQQFLPPELSLVECWQKLWPAPFGTVNGLVEATEAIQQDRLLVLISGGRDRAKAEDIAKKLGTYLAELSPPIETTTSIKRSCCDF